MPKSVKHSVKKKPQSRTRYSDDDKMKAVMLYRQSGNLSRTAAEVGVSRVTLTAWAKEYPDIRKIDPATSLACVRAVEEASAIRQAFLQKHYDALSQVIEKGLRRADMLINKAENLGSVVNAIEKLSAVVKDFTPTDNEQNPVQVNLLQQTINKE